MPTFLSLVLECSFTISQLEWQDNILIIKKWNDAINYCEDLELDNKNDWRVPTINELKSIIKETQYAPTIDKSFKYTRNYRYWSSTTTKNTSTYKFVINFTNGSILTYNGYNSSSYTSFVRCVRDAEN